MLRCRCALRSTQPTRRMSSGAHGSYSVAALLCGLLWCDNAVVLRLARVDLPLGLRSVAHRAFGFEDGGGIELLRRAGRHSPRVEDDERQEWKHAQDGCEFKFDLFGSHDAIRLSIESLRGVSPFFSAPSHPPIGQ